MGYQSKTYSLSDEVVGWLEELRSDYGSINKGLLAIMAVNENVERGVSRATLDRIDATAKREPLPVADPRTIPGVSVGAPLNAYCIHCQTKFAGAKGASTCIPCGRDGHVTAGNCRRCAEIARASKLAASPTGVDDPGIDYDWKDPA